MIWVLYIAAMLVVLLWLAAVFMDDLSTVDVMPLIFLMLLIFTAGNILLTLKECIIYRRQNQYSMKIAAQLKLEADVERSINRYLQKSMMCCFGISILKIMILILMLVLFITVITV